MMKCVLLALLLATAASTGAADQEDRTISKVVKLLQGLLDTSKADGDSDRELYAKYKCYCDTNENDKNEEIEKLTEQIGLLESKIEELQAANGKLSKEVAQLDADMAENKASQKEANEIRKKENEAFVALEKDLEDAIGTMEDAIKALSDIGADQTMSEGADHKQFMADYEEGKSASLVKLRATVKQALLAASAFVSKKQIKGVDAFLQAPFTGTYTAQSGQVVGILKDMLDTFTTNLKAAQDKEAKQLKAHTEYIKEMEAAWKEMKDSYDDKQGTLGDNDGALSSKKGQLKTAEDGLAEAQDFLEKLLDMCAAKKKQYDQRVQLRTSEEAALAEAISILNSDAAFETFGTVDATKTGATSFVQRASVRRHRLARRAAPSAAAAPKAEDSKRGRVQEFLQKAAGAQSSPILSRILAMLQASNPFKTVLAEIDKMIQLLADEESADKEQLDWCTDERKTTTADITKKGNDITALEGAINTLTQTIEDPETGLKVMIKNDEEKLQTNYENQVSETKDRKEDNVAYQKDVKNLVDAQALLERATAVLTKYYAKKMKEMQADLVQLKQKKKDEPAPPQTWEEEYKGQSEGGTSAIDMLEFIIKNTKQEETQAHSDEETAQHDYEDSMQGLKDEEGNLQKSLADNRELLAEKEEELMDKKKELAKTEEEKAALEAYLEKIKPGCDFITENYDTRKSNRKEEKSALENAVKLLQGAPAYKEAMEVAHNETLGDCKLICVQDADHVDCKACLAKVSVPGYCAGHPSTSGC